MQTLILITVTFVINCTYCGELLTTWTHRRLNDDNHSPFLYNVQSVKATLNNCIHCKGLQYLLRNLELTALIHVSFQKITKLFAADEVIFIIIIEFKFNHKICIQIASSICRKAVRIV